MPADIPEDRQINVPARAAAKAGFSTATAYRIEAEPQLPSQKKKPRGRRRPDPLAGVRDNEIVPMLEAAPSVRTVAIFEEMCGRHPEVITGVSRDTSWATTASMTRRGARLFWGDAHHTPDARMPRSGA